ncbi:MAG: SRPBCC family protein [Phormidesmis sp.]
MENSLVVAQKIDICAPPSLVWEALTHAAAYKDWNPCWLIEESPEQLTAGAQLKLRVALGTSNERVFEAEVLRAIAPTVLEWQGGEPGVFEGLHRFELYNHELNQTRLVNSESFSGEMAADVLQMSRTVLEKEFSLFNEALKTRAELMA